MLSNFFNFNFQKKNFSKNKNNKYCEKFCSMHVLKKKKKKPNLLYNQQFSYYIGALEMGKECKTYLYFLLRKNNNYPKVFGIFLYNFWASV